MQILQTGQELVQLIELKGPDTQDFLNRLTTVNTRSLEPGQGRPGFFLNPQGKVEAYFRLWRAQNERFLFEVEPGREGRWKTRLLETIDRYTFAEKMELKADLELQCLWLFVEPENESAALTSLGLAELQAEQCRETEEGLLVLHHGSRDFGRTWLAIWGEPAKLESWRSQKLEQAGAAATADPVTLEAWRIEQGRPALDHEITENTIPLELGMLEAIAENKGCYPGQEVIERIISIGSPARRLVRLQKISGSGELASSARLVTTSEPPASAGEITSASGDLALALVKKAHAKEGTELQVESGGAILRVLRVK